MYTYRFSETEIFEIISIWSEIANEKGGTFKNILCTGPGYQNSMDSVLKKFELLIPNFQNTSIIFTTSETHPLRVDYKFTKDLGFEFQISPEDFLFKISKLFGAKEVEIGIKEVDDEFIFKSDNALLINYLMDEKSIRYLQGIALSAINLNSNDCSELDMVLAVNERDKDQMLKLLEFIENMIQKLYDWR